MSIFDDMTDEQKSKFSYAASRMFVESVRMLAEKLRTTNVAGSSIAEIQALLRGTAHVLDGCADSMDDAIEFREDIDRQLSELHDMLMDKLGDLDGVEL